MSTAEGFVSGENEAHMPVPILPASSGGPDGLPWDVYQTRLSELRVLSGNWAFNTQMRILLNGSTTKNGAPITSPQEVAGIMRAYWDNPGRGVGFFLKSESEEGRSSEIRFVQ